MGGPRGDRRELRARVVRALLIAAVPVLLLGCSAGASPAPAPVSGQDDSLLVVLLDEGGVSDAVVEQGEWPIQTEGAVSDHATAMASILLGLGEGQRPLPADQVRLQVVPVALTTGTGPAELAAAIGAAVEAGARVVAIPMGTRTDEPDLAAAVERAAAAGVVVVAAAGNIGPLTPDYPARYDAVVSVEAQDADGHPAQFSAAGDVSVLGVDVPALDVDARPTTVTGTSAATALVAHHVVRAALDGALDPHPDPDESVRRIVETP